MSNTLRFTSLARAAALSLALVAPAAVTAYAADEYGTNQETVVRHAASSLPAAPLSLAQQSALGDAFKLGQNDAFGAARSSQLAPVAQNYMVRLASASAAVAKDVVGAGGAQDELANAIYQPGSGTDW